MGGERDGQEISRRIRDELDRIRDAEGRVEEALETVRQARRRVEVVARELAREEERVRAWVREELKASSGSGRGTAAGGLAPGGNATADDAAAEPGDDAETPSRSWRSDAPLGWSTWREAPAAAREPSAPAPAALGPLGSDPDASGRPTESLEREARADEMPARTPTVLGQRRPAAPETDAEIPPRAAPGYTVPPPRGRIEEDRSLWWTRAGIAALAVLATVLIGWFAIRGLRRESASAPQPAVEATAPAAAAPAPVQPEPAAPPVTAAASPLAVLPADAAARQALYDSLFTARSPLFDPLITQVQSETKERAVERALTAWREGPLDAQDADLVHSALLQHVLKADVDPRIEIDGQVLRTPCRGRSCTALMNAWEQRQAALQLPPVPANASTDPRELRQAEAALVLGWLRSMNTPAAPVP